MANGPPDGSTGIESKQAVRRLLAAAADVVVVVFVAGRKFATEGKSYAEIQDGRPIDDDDATFREGLSKGFGGGKLRDGWVLSRTSNREDSIQRGDLKF